ncbi:MAG: glutamate--tRNA ligase [Holosporaceae bacterium]|jgi:glutamyl-tRNA synthetase|nr:glutamate--tRNA ligase [Holosporaceae bacterium]
MDIENFSGQTAKLVTRFAPSPTGFLHIGGARTALFNWLLARHCGGKFLLRIEDTDRERSTQEAVDAIFDGLRWLGIDWDEEPVFQSSRLQHHVELAQNLVKEGKAYYCYCTPEELEAMREEAKSRGESPKYNGKWRDRDPREAPPEVKPVIRLKAPTEGSTVLHDIVQGTVTVSNDQLDDMILVRSDGTPTFMLSVVVDDHDMGITCVIRGDDHLTNTFRHIQIFNAFGWDIPQFGHVPLIHGPDGAKLSKRHGALGIDAYRDMGYLPEAICNCLLRLGWSHGDDEIITREQATQWFNTENLGKSASRLDFLKLDNLNGHYLRVADNHRLLKDLLKIVGEVSEEKQQRLLRGMNGLKQRAKTLLELQDLALIYINDQVKLDLTAEEKNILQITLQKLRNISSDNWIEENIEAELRTLAATSGFSFGKIAQALRNALTGRKVTPSIFDMLFSFGKDESLSRIDSLFV